MKSLLFSVFFFTQFAHAQLIYPVAKKITQTEVRFGTTIVDDYKWMENASDPDLWDWIDAQKALTNSYLDANLLDGFATRYLELRKIQKEQNDITGAAIPDSVRPGLPWDVVGQNKKENHLIRWKTFRKNFKSNGPKPESALYEVQSKPVASGDLYRIIITQKSDNKVADILHVKFYSFVTWADDNSFYYVSDMDERIGGGKPTLFKHTVGEIQSEDQLIITGRSATSNLVIHEIDGKFFAEVDESIGAIQLSTGKVTNRHLIDGEIVDLSNSPDTEVTVLNFNKTNFGECYKLRLRDGNRRLFIKEQDFVLVSTKNLNEDSTFVLGLKDGAHVAGIYNIFTGLKMIDLQDGTISFVDFKDGLLKISHETFATPKKIYSYKLETGELGLLAAQTFPVDVEAQKVYYTATNGQQAAMWVMTKKGTKLSAKTPTILFGYGGFRVSITPTFNLYESLSWIEKGGAYVVVALPGSLDYGESWYQLARVGGRINSWDSYALAAKELYKLGYTSPEHCGIMGASNGGTLTAGTLQRHSDIFKAAVPMVGVMDLINFTLFTAGKYWTNDYGNPFIENDFKAMFPLSPYHNIKKRDYPATMVMTAEFDDRVVPMHSYKYLARLQELNTSSAPILLYNKEWGAHGRISGSPKESSRYVAAFYTFFAQQLGL